MSQPKDGLPRHEERIIAGHGDADNADQPSRLKRLTGVDLFCRCPVLGVSIPADFVAERDPCFGSADCPNHHWWTTASFELSRSHGWQDRSFWAFAERADGRTLEYVEAPEHRSEVAAVCSEAERHRLITWRAVIPDEQPLNKADLDDVVEVFRLLLKWDQEQRK